MNCANSYNCKTYRLWTKDYILLMLSNTFLFFGDSLLLPVLPVYVKQHGANDIQVGIVAAVFFATSILMRIFTGRASAHLGKKTLLILALSVFAFAMLGYYLFASLIIIIILRLVQGIGFGASTTLYSTTAANIIPKEKLGEGMGYFGLGVTIAYALGPCLGAAAVSLTNYKWVFLAAVALEIIGILFTIFINVDNCKKTVEKNTGIKGLLKDIIEPKAFYQAVFMLLIGLATGGFSTYVVLFAKEMNIGNISVYFVIVSLAEFFVRFFSGKLYDKKGMNIVVIPGAVSAIIGCIVMAYATDLLMVSISAILCGISSGMIFPIMEASAMKIVAPERRVAANATLYNFLDIGTGLGPIMFGTVVQMSGYKYAFLVSGLIFALMLLIVVVTTIINSRKKSADTI